MAGVRVLVGTRKGAFVLTSDEGRKDWQVQGPLFGGWEVYHLKGSPVDTDRIWASQSGGWFGQLVQRSDDGGRTFAPVGNDFTYDGVPGTHQWYDGTPHPWEFARVWHLEPSLTDADTVYAGVEDAALFRTSDGGATWAELSGLRRHGSGPHWQPGAGGLVGALEERYPALRGTMRDPVTGRRRPFVRLFACREDLSHQSPDDPLPDPVLREQEPLLIVGAMAGG